MSKNKSKNQSIEYITTTICSTVLPAITTLILIVTLLVCPGCKKTKDELLSEMDTIYIDIRTVITDESVHPLIKLETLSKLQDAEQKYLAAVAIIKKGRGETLPPA